jgi:hypothetical protein
MANVRITRIRADDWTDLNLPISGSPVTLQNADTAKGFSYRSHADDPFSQLDIAPGYGLELSTTIRIGQTAGQVKGGQIIVCIGIRLPRPINSGPRST